MVLPNITIHYFAPTNQMLMEFTAVLANDATEAPGFVVVENGHEMDELIGRPNVPTKHGNEAYHVDNVKSYMERNHIDSILVFYLP